MTKSGWEIEADPRHGELVIKEMELDGAKGLTTQGVDEPLQEEDVERVGWRATRFRSVAARANDLALDRPDLQFALKELCRSMSKPTEGACKKLIRLAKYLILKPG